MVSPTWQRFGPRCFVSSFLSDSFSVPLLSTFFLAIFIYLDQIKYESRRGIPLDMFGPNNIEI